MNYLFTYLQLLSESELDAVRQLELAPREQETLEYLLDLLNRKEHTREQAMSDLGMSRAHFDKVSSRLLREVYRTTVPEGGPALLHDLNRRSLHGHFTHEMRRQEKDLSARGADAEMVAEFYLQCFTMLQRTARVNYDLKLSQELARKYERLRPSPDNAVLFEASMISSSIWNAAARGENTARADAIARRLRSNDERITASTGPLALYRHYNASALYYTQIKTRPCDCIDYLQRAAELCEAYPDILSSEEKALTLCKIAETRYNDSDFRGAYRDYASLFKRYGDIVRKDFYHTTKFVQLCVIEQRFDQAERLLRERFAGYIASDHSAMSVMAAISYAKLYLCSGRHDKARRFIDLGYRHNAKNFYVHYEIELRLLETTYFFMKEEFAFVETLANKHLKYLRSKGYTLKTSRYYPWFLKLAVAFIDERSTNKTIRRELERKLDEFREGPAAIYGTLLRMMRCKRTDD